jgi:NTP pyrophosphatase (non-canonical NTP hydrolase)
MNVKELQKSLYQEYLREEKDKIFKDKGEVGDIAELGMITEEIGEAIVDVRKKKRRALQRECADIIIRTICFMSRKGIDLQKALEQAHRKNVKRCRKGLFIQQR